MRIHWEIFHLLPLKQFSQVVNRFASSITSSIHFNRLSACVRVSSLQVVSPRCVSNHSNEGSACRASIIVKVGSILWAISPNWRTVPFSSICRMCSRFFCVSARKVFIIWRAASGSSSEKAVRGLKLNRFSIDVSGNCLVGTGVVCQSVCSVCWHIFSSSCWLKGL